MASDDRGIRALMSWARMDDSFHDHPKVVGLPLAAVGLWTLCLSWAHRHARKAATKGAVSRAVVYRLGGSDEIAALLVDAELWELADDGWVIHDFEDYLRADDPAVKAQAAASETAVYRIYDAASNLLYVGVAVDVFARLDRHYKKKSWWNLVHSVTVELYADRGTAMLEELRSIRAELPRFNIQGCGGLLQRQVTPPKQAPVVAAQRYTWAGGT